MRRARTAALTTAVGLCVIVPLAAASADSGDREQTYPAAAPHAPTSPAPVLDFGSGVSADASDGASGGLLPGVATPARGAGRTTDMPRATAAATAPAQPGERCGSAVRTPDGVGSQTCVEQAAGEIWGRAYYHAPKASAAVLVLNLTQPGGSTVSMTCQVAAGSDDGACETPHLRGDGGPDGWSAVSEMAAADASRVLVRSGTATAGG